MAEIVFIAEADDDIDLGAIAEEGTAETDGAEVKPAGAIEAFDPLTVAVVVGAALAVVKVVAWVIDRIRGGLEVRLDATPPTLKRNRDVPHGMIFVFLNDGKVDIQVKDEAKDSLERMFEVLFKLPVDATVQMAKDALAAAKGGKEKEEDAGESPQDPAAAPAG